MAKQIRLLDCTLRDGGYVNDWEFGNGNLIRIYERLVAAGTDIIEVGFLDERRPFDKNRSIFPNTDCIEKIWGCSKTRPEMVVGMIDYGTCGIDQIADCKDSYLDGIRVIFKKHIMHEAMEFCAQVKAKGYKVFSQLVSITAYTDEELMELITLVNEVEPYAVSMVDTYGLLHPDDMLHYYELLDAHVKPQVQIGFHAHNNFQLAYANVLAFIEKKTQRDIVVDATMYGMGKSAGNAPYELVAMQLNENYGAHYHMAPILECIEESIMDFYCTNPWGYKMFFYLSAANRCHPTYVGDYQKKGNLSIAKLNDILGSIEPYDNKLLYDKKISEETYQKYVKEHIEDDIQYQKLADDLCNKTVLLLGPGRNIRLQEEKVKTFIESNKSEELAVVSINYIPEEYLVNYVFATKRNRYQQMTLALHDEKNADVKIIGTSNIESVNGEFAFTVDRAPLLEMQEDIIDNSFLMLLKVLAKCNVKKVYCAGLDGYSDKEDNYDNPQMEYGFLKQEARYLNRHIREVITKMRQQMEIEFITYSHYEEENDWHSAAF